MSARALRIAMIVLTTIGLGVASYLTYVHYAGIKPACTAGESCTKVQTSIYSELAGVPVALIGLIGYVVILGSLLAPETETTRFATVAFTVVGFGFSCYLTGRELFSIHAICEWCVSSAVIMTLLMCLSVWRFLRGDPQLRDAPAELAPSDTTAPLSAAR
ncbi:MAG TPA: vitamin K epoxide reductase family protein [Solirubrobacteraceae bacterium]|nr:vitamin K epoxide reductase family protein [Solirubrobacteraceae bacterium]